MNAVQPANAVPRADSGLIEGLLRGESRALARALTAVENGLESAPAILAAIQPHHLQRLPGDLPRPLHLGGADQRPDHYVVEHRELGQRPHLLPGAGHPPAADLVGVEAVHPLAVEEDLA